MHNSVRFNKPTFVLLIGPCRFNFSQALASTWPFGCFMLLNRNIMHTYTLTRSSWLPWQSPHPPGQCLDPSLTSRHAFPLSFSLSFSSSFSVKTRSATTGVILRSSYFQLMLMLNVVSPHAHYSILLTEINIIC